MITVAGQIFTESKKKIYISNQIFKGCEDCIGDKKIENDILDKVCGDICSENDEVFKTNSINRFINFYILINVNCNQTKNGCGKRYQKSFIEFSKYNV